MNTPSNESSSLACHLIAIPSELHEEHGITASQHFALAQQVQELSDGYIIRFLNKPSKFMAIARLIENERLRCSFFHFELEVEPNGGPLWLRLTGDEGVKDPCRDATGHLS